MLKLRNAAATTLQQYPLQLGRAFVRGEIAQAPKLSVNGSALATQAEVPLRWDDGSVRFAVLSAVLPDVASGATVTLGFSSQAPVSGALSVNDLLSQFPDFDAKLALTSGSTTRSASARSMLSAGLGKFVAQGPQRYSLIVADHTGRSKDFGFDAYTPLRPVFYIDFWPALNKVRVRASVHSPNLDALEDVSYNAVLSSGVAAPTVVWSKSGVNHYFGTRWSKTFWVGGAPETKVDLNHNIGYLAATGFIPNYDPQHQPGTQMVDGWIASWAGVGKDIYEDGFWTHYMPTTGHRSEIGPMPAWMAAWLQTGDYRLRDISLTQADLANAWPTHFREHSATLKFDRASIVPAQGRFLSLNAHPTLWFPDNNGNYAGILPTPRILDANNTPSGSWIYDGAHQPDPFSVPYLTTGDTYYLEALQSWASISAIGYAPGLYGRGQAGYGGMQDQIRGNGWVIRNRALAAALSPDGSAEKLYFYQLMDDAIAFWEGQRGINDADFISHPNRVWAATNYAVSWSPLRFWLNDTENKQTALWQEWFFMGELGFARDLGFPTGRLLSDYSALLSEQIGRSDYDARNIATYRTPTMNASQVNYTSWAQVSADLQANHANYITAANNTFALSGDAVYAVAAATAGSYITPYTKGPEAWAWLKTQAYDRMDYSGEYTNWRILPRSSLPPVPPKPAGL